MTDTPGNYLVASLTPHLLNIHGDAENARVLAARASWRGYRSEVIEVRSAADAAGLSPQAITIGSGFDSDAREVLHALETFGEELRQWVAAGVPLLAIGLGWELLSAQTVIEDYGTLPGIGVFQGTFIASARRSGPIVLDSRWGKITGYEYHYRDYLLGEDEAPLGTIIATHNTHSGISGSLGEGAIRGAAIGTALRGPILARNPNLADALLGEFATPYSATATVGSPQMQLADSYATAANLRVREAMER